jgi:RNA polymerase sigma-70 factor (ECF subfamily)
MAVSRETIELAYLAALQHLAPRQRAVLILRDVLDWSAKETAALLETTVPSVNSALQRAKATLKVVRGEKGSGWGGAASKAEGGTGGPSEEEREALRRFIAAWERDDVGGLTALLREDARWAMPPAPLWFDGRRAIERLLELFPMSFQGSFRMVPVGANRQPAAASYLRPHGNETYRLTGINVLRIEEGRIAEITTFSAVLCRAFGLPETL